MALIWREPDEHDARKDVRIGAAHGGGAIEISIGTTSTPEDDGESIEAVLALDKAETFFQEGLHQVQQLRGNKYTWGRNEQDGVWVKDAKDNFVLIISGGTPEDIMRALRGLGLRPTEDEFIKQGLL